jgi:hypothetical protein
MSTISEEGARQLLELDKVDLLFALQELAIPGMLSGAFLFYKDGQEYSEPPDKVLGLIEAILSRVEEIAPYAKKAMDAYHREDELLLRIQKLERALGPFVRAAGPPDLDRYFYRCIIHKKDVDVARKLLGGYSRNVISERARGTEAAENEHTRPSSEPCPRCIEEGGRYRCDLQPDSALLEREEMPQNCRLQRCSILSAYLGAELERLRSENAQLNGQQSAVRDMAASEVDDLKEEIAARDARIIELERENSKLRRVLGPFSRAVISEDRDFCKVIIHKSDILEARAALQGKATPEGPTHRCMVCGWKGSAEDAGRHADEAHPDEGVVPMVCRGSHQTRTSRWIPVAEEDPEEDTLVFVANMDASFKSITIGMFNGQRWRTYNGVGIYVTHWMSLPFPDWPEKGEDAPGEGEDAD